MAADLQPQLPGPHTEVAGAPEGERERGGEMGRERDETMQGPPLSQGPRARQSSRRSPQGDRNTRVVGGPRARKGSRHFI